MNVPNMRGKKETFTCGNDSLSITELLQKPEIVGYLEKDGPLTYAFQREKLRKLLREGRINPQVVMEHAARNPTAPRVQDTRYGTQRRRANLPGPNHHRGYPGDLLAPLSSMERTSRPAKYWSGIPNSVNSSNRVGEFRRSPYTQRCERGFGRERSQTTSSTRNPRSFPEEGCWGTT